MSADNCLIRRLMSLPRLPCVCSNRLLPAAVCSTATAAVSATAAGVTAVTSGTSAMSVFLSLGVSPLILIKRDLSP